MSAASAPLEVGVGGAANPFSPRAVLALVVFGAVVFVALLWMIGSGMTGSTNDGGAHVGGKGLNGYAAFAGFLERRGYTVGRLRSEGRLDDPGLLVLTPPQTAKGKDIDAIVAKRRSVGPTLVIAPKWYAAPAQGAPGARRGWVSLLGTGAPAWDGFLDDVSVDIAPMPGGRWAGAGASGRVPVAGKVESGQGRRLAPLVIGGEDGRILAAYVDDGGVYPGLERIAVKRAVRTEERTDLYPIVLVFEPDLLDNYGMAKPTSAQLADRLVQAATAGGERTVNFDLTLNGFARQPNLLTLAFTPPFLAATLCLLLAALAVGWRAFQRFGPPRAAPRAIAFGKRALVANAAGLIRRSRRLHLIAAPYATRARERLAHVLALQRQADADATEAAIDRALAARAPGAMPFSGAAARLRAARSPHDLLKAAQELHALERTLIR
jgi:hypothetical protein